MRLASPAFRNDATIPKRYTEDGPNVSPPLEWTDAPEDARSFALVCDDPDSKTEWTHWLLYDLPKNVRHLPEDVPREDNVLGGAEQGSNDFGSIGWGGPAPPPGKPHHYVFKLYALDADLEIAPGATKQHLQEAMEGHVIAEAKLVGTYERTSARA